MIKWNPETGRYEDEYGNPVTPAEKKKEDEKQKEAQKTEEPSTTDQMLSSIPPGTFTTVGTAIAPGVGTGVGAALDTGLGMYNSKNGSQESESGITSPDTMKTPPINPSQPMPSPEGVMTPTSGKPASGVGANSVSTKEEGTSASKTAAKSAAADIAASPAGATGAGIATDAALSAYGDEGKSKEKRLQEQKMKLEIAGMKRDLINRDVDLAKTGTIQLIQSVLAPFGLG